MVSPLSFFRRHSKVLLVIVTAITVLTFTVGGVILQFFQGHAPAGTVDAGAVVATWDGGSITEGELMRARRRREIVAAVLGQIDRMRAERATDSVPKAPGLLLGSSDEQIVIDEIMAERAREMGIRVTDADVNAYLALYSDQLVSPEEISDIFRKYAGAEMQSSDFFERMKKELAILQMYLAYQSASPAVTPAAAWEAYLRTSRKVQATVVPFPVEDFLADVKEEPSRGEINAYYEKHKTQYVNPLSYEVGFRRPYEAKFGYFQAKFDDFLQREKSKITDEAVRSAYDEAIARGEFRELELPGVGEDPLPNETTPPATPTPPGDTPLPPAEEAPAPPATPPGEAAPGTPAPEGSSPESTTPESSTPETPAPEGESTTPGEEPEQNAALSAGDDRLFVALQEEGAPAAQPDSGQPEPEQPETDAPANDAPATETPAVEAAPVAAPPSGAVIVGSPDLNAKAPAPPGAETTPAAPVVAAPKFKPFEEVADELRLRLARPAAQRAMEQAIQEAAVTVDEYSSRLAAAFDGTAAPARPNFRHIASNLGLTYAETPMLNAFATRTDEGKPYYGLITASEMDFSQPMMGQQFASRTFAQSGFNPRLPLFEPTTLFVPNRFSMSDAYVFWKTDQKEAEIPPLDEIRDEVVKAWKIEKARELAEAAAAKAAEEASAKAASIEPNAEGVRESALTQLFPKKAKSAGEFQFLPHQFDPQAGEIQNVESPGPEIRQAIFALRTGEAGYGPNADRSVYYAVEVTKDLQPPADSVERFLAMPTQFLMQMIQPSLMGERQNFQYEVFREMTDQVGLEWKRPPAEENRQG